MQNYQFPLRMKPIAESELILNKDGSVYHLNLLPEELSDVVINVGDPDRVGMVSDYFDTVEVRKQKREFVTHTGTYKGRRMSVISTGIGTDNIDIVYNELDALVNVDLKTRMVKPELTSISLVRIGTSGALQADIPVDSFVCSTHGLGLDGLLNYYRMTNTEDESRIVQAFRQHYPNLGVLPQTYLASADPGLVHLLSPGMVSGMTASCAGFYAPQMRSIRLEPSRMDMIEKLNSFRFGEHRVTNFEMETGAMFGLARLLGHKACSTNVIVANRIEHAFSKNADASMHLLIQTVLDRLSSL
ncbi:MAG: nucleoside phosphorylase [Sphingobacteriales bacterium]|nr:nucleoside phosphorylase [Sphingobacteriales bacterium]